MVSADTLRRAAALLRERASVTVEGPWVAERFYWKFESPAMPDGWWWHISDGAGDVALSSERDDAEPDTAKNRVEYIATMHPGVGLALADWLDDELSNLEGLGVTWGANHPAVVLARLILGEES